MCAGLLSYHLIQVPSPVAKISEEIKGKVNTRVLCVFARGADPGILFRSGSGFTKAIRKLENQKKNVNVVLCLHTKGQMKGLTLSSWIRIWFFTGFISGFATPVFARAAIKGGSRKINNTLPKNNPKMKS